MGTVWAAGSALGPGAARREGEAARKFRVAPRRWERRARGL